MSSFAYPLGIVILLAGYTLAYSGWSNLTTEGHGISFLDAVNGVPFASGGAALAGAASGLASPTANLTGNTPQTGTPPQTVFV